jgi:hypothetical protein
MDRDIPQGNRALLSEKPREQPLLPVSAYVTEPLNDRKKATKEIQSAAARVPALALAEIAFLICLTSADIGVSQLAAQCLRLLAHAERQLGASTAQPNGNSEELYKRHPIYEQLGDPNVTIIGVFPRRSISCVSRS